MEDPPSLFPMVGATTNPVTTPSSMDAKATPTSLTSLTNVFVAGLPVDFDEPRLRALFGAYGEVSSCKIMVDIDSGISKGFGFVRYIRPEDAAAAIDAMNGKKLGNTCTRPMYVTLAQHDGTTTLTECERIYIRNVPPYVTDKELLKAFREYGEILECKVLRHPPSDLHPEGLSKGVAFVKYRSVEEALNAVTKAQGSRPFGPGDSQFNKPVMVRFAENQEARQQRQTRAAEIHHNSFQSPSQPMMPPPQSPQPVVPVIHPGPTPSIPPQPMIPIVPNTSSASFVWEDPSSGWVFTTVATAPTGKPQMHGSHPILLQSHNPMGVQLPQFVTQMAPQVIFGAGRATTSNPPSQGLIHPQHQQQQQMAQYQYTPSQFHHQHHQQLPQAQQHMAIPMGFTTAPPSMEQHMGMLSTGMIAPQGVSQHQMGHPAFAYMPK